MLVRVRVEIGKLVFTAVNHVEVNSNIKAFTKTATIKLPKRIRFKSNGKETSTFNPNKTIQDYIKPGDPVTIYMGYGQYLKKEFEGYISSGIEPAVPLVLHCECEMWQLKRKTVNVSIENATIKQVIKAIAPEYKTDVLDAEIGDFSMKNTTAVKVLNELRKRYGVLSYFIDKTLIVGKPYTNKKVINTAPKTYKYTHNIISDTLKYVSPDDYKIQVKAISIMPDNSKIEITVGDKTGDMRTLHFFDKTKQELERLANEHIKLFKSKGYEGTVTSFGFPILNIGNKVQIIDNSYEKRNSTHLVDAVKVWIGDGYRREITIGLKA